VTGRSPLGGSPLVGTPRGYDAEVSAKPQSAPRRLHFDKGPPGSQRDAAVSSGGGDSLRPQPDAAAPPADGGRGSGAAPAAQAGGAEAAPQHMSNGSGETAVLIAPLESLRKVNAQLQQQVQIWFRT